MTTQLLIPIERVKYLLNTCARYFDNTASEREVENFVDDMIGAERVDAESLADPDGRDARRELAEKILLKLIEIAPYVSDSDLARLPDGLKGPEIAWRIADAFLKAEKGTT